MRSRNKSAHLVEACPGFTICKIFATVTSFPIRSQISALLAVSRTKFSPGRKYVYCRANLCHSMRSANSAQGLVNNREHPFLLRLEVVGSCDDRGNQRVQPAFACRPPIHFEYIILSKLTDIQLCVIISVSICSYSGFHQTLSWFAGLLVCAFYWRIHVCSNIWIFMKPNGWIFVQVELRCTDLSSSCWLEFSHQIASQQQSPKSQWHPKQHRKTQTMPKVRSALCEWPLLLKVKD